MANSQPGKTMIIAVAITVLGYGLTLPGPATGQILDWAERAGTGGVGGFDTGLSIDVDGDGNAYIGGDFNGDAGGFADFGSIMLPLEGSLTPFLAKYDAAGIAQWAHGFNSPSIDGAPYVAVDGNANVYVAGEFGNTIDFDPSSSVANLTSTGPCVGKICNPDVFVAKYDSDGNFTWAFRMGSGANDFPRAIAVDNGHVYITGFFVDTVDFDPGPGTFNLTSAGNLDIFIAKYDQDGNFVWARRIGSSTPGAEGVSGLGADASGNVYVTGYFDGTLDFDPGSGTENITSVGGSDIFLLKLDAAGLFDWALGIGGSERDEGRGVDVDSAGNSYLCGEFRDTVFFDPRSGTSDVTSEGSADAFLASFTSSGDLRWVHGFGDAESDIGWGVSVDSADDVHFAGSFVGTVDFAPDPDTFELTSHGHDAFAARYDADGNLLGAANAGGRDASATGFDIAGDSSGNSLIVGDFSRSCDFDPGDGSEILTSAGRDDIFVWKLAPNSPPSCNLVDPGIVECQGSSTMVSLDGSGSSDPDGDAITFSWSSDCPDATFDDDTSPTPVLTLTSDAPCPLTCNVALTVTDTGGLSDTCSVTVRVDDTIVPVITCPSDLTVECVDDVPGPDVLLVSAMDDCDATPHVAHIEDTDNGGSGCLGDPLIVSRTYRATDACGNSADCTQTITVEDTTAPEVTCSVETSRMWPPNHALISVGLSATATDNCDDDPEIGVKIYSDEDDEEKTGDGQHSADAQDIALETLRLRAERQGNSDGRVYLIVITGTDECGNTAVTCCTVTVAKSQSQSDLDLVAKQAEDARQYCETNGMPPPGFNLVGDGPDVGPKQ